MPLGGVSSSTSCSAGGTHPKWVPHDTSICGLAGRFCCMFTSTVVRAWRRYQETCKYSRGHGGEEAIGWFTSQQQYYRYISLLLPGGTENAARLECCKMSFAGYWCACAWWGMIQNQTGWYHRSMIDGELHCFRFGVPFIFWSSVFYLLFIVLNISTQAYLQSVRTRVKVPY